MAYINPFTGKPYMMPWALGGWNFAAANMPVTATPTIQTAPATPTATPTITAAPVTSTAANQPTFPAYNGVRTVPKFAWKKEEDLRAPFPSYTSRRNRI